MEPHQVPTHSISPHTISHSPLSHPHTATTEEHTLPSYTSMEVTPSAAATLVEMLTRIDALDPLPKLQVEAQRLSVSAEGGLSSEEPVQNIEVTTTPVPQTLPPNVHTPLTTVTITESPAPITSETISSLIGHIPGMVSNEVDVQTTTMSLESDGKKPRVGRPRTKPVKEKKEWHYHLGGVRHSRVPLSPELKEVLEVAYVSRIMSKNFRKEGQPEKERIARITGMEFDKVQEWFKNRRKKDKHKGEHSVPKKRGRPSKASILKNQIPPAVTSAVAIALESTPIYCTNLSHSVNDIQVTPSDSLELSLQ